MYLVQIDLDQIQRIALRLPKLQSLKGKEKVKEKKKEN